MKMEGTTGARIQALTSFGDDGLQLIALEELNQMLSLGQQGEFRVSAYVPALIKVISRATGNPQLVLMAARALCQIMDIDPRAGSLAVSEGVLPLLVSRLLSISDLDVAEQCIKCLHIVAGHHPREVLHAGALKAILAFFDFFPQHLQRKVIDTALLLCHDSGQQIEDAVHLLESLPGLMLCLESTDERILVGICQCITIIISCYGSAGTVLTRLGPSTSSHRLHYRVSQPTVDCFRTLQHFNAVAPRTDSTQTLHEIDLGPFEPKYSSQWRTQVLTKICTEKVLKRMLGLLARKANNEDISSVLSALARLVKMCPHAIITLLDGGLLDILKGKLSTTGSSKSSESLTSALRVVQAMLPPVPHAKSFERSENGELCDAAQYDASLVLSDADRKAASERRADLAAKSNRIEQSKGQGEDGTDAIMNEEDEFWACSLCTYHNPKTASACDMCGQVSPQISERASRMDQGGTSGDAMVGSSENKDPADLLKDLLDSWEDYTLGIHSTAQLYKEMPELLDKIATELMPDLTQVAAKSANPDHRTRSLAALASLLYCMPRPLLESISRMFGPGGNYYVGVVHAGLQSQNPHVVASTLRLAMVELWRFGITVSLKREGVPQLIRGLGARFPEPAGTSASDAERIHSIRRRAAAWLSYYDHLSATDEKMLETFVDAGAFGILAKLKNVGERLLAVERGPELESLSSGLEKKVSISPKAPTPALEEMETPPKKKTRRMTTSGSLLSPQPTPSTSPVPVCAQESGQTETIRCYKNILVDLNTLLRSGIVASEFQASGLAPIMAGLASNRPEFVFAMREVFGDTSVTNTLVRTLHDALDGAERFAVVKHGITQGDSYRALKAHIRGVAQPTGTSSGKLRKALKPFISVDITEDDFSFPVKVDPLAKANEVESYIWNQIKAKVIELKNASSTKPETSSSGSSKRSAVSLGLSSSSFDTDRDDSKYAMLQAGDPVHVIQYLRPGLRVVRGRDWKWADQDGGPGRTGIVTDVRSWNGQPDSCIRVRWDANKSTNVYRYNVENAFDLALAPRVPSKKIIASGKNSKILVENGLLASSTEEFRRALKRGDKVDAMDCFFCWYKAEVRVVVPKNDSREGAARVSFEGFSARYDEWIPLSSLRLAPPSSRVTGSGFTSGQVDDAGEGYLRMDAAAFSLSPAILLGGAIDSSATAMSQENDLGGEDGDSNDDEEAESVKELPSNVRIKCEDNVLVQPGMSVRMRRRSDADEESSWWTGLILHLGYKSPIFREDKKQQASSSASTEGGTGNESQEGDQPESKSAEPEDEQTAVSEIVGEDGAAGSGNANMMEVKEEGHLFALVKRVVKLSGKEDGAEDDEEEEEVEEEEDEEGPEWVDLTSVIVHLPSDSPSNEVESIGSTKSTSTERIGFAKVALMGREVWIPIRIITETDEENCLVESKFEDVALNFSFSTRKATILPSVPRGSFIASSKELKAIAKALRELDCIEGKESSDRQGSALVSARRSASSSPVPVSTAECATMNRVETALATTSGMSQLVSRPAEDDELDDDGISRSPIPLPTDAPAQPVVEGEEKQQKMKALQNARTLYMSSSRTRTLTREYSAVDFTSELTSTSLHHSLSAAAAMASRLILVDESDGRDPRSSSLEKDQKKKPGQANAEQVPVRILLRRFPSDTMHLCLARLSAKEDYGNIGGVGIIEYSIDFSHPSVETMYQALQAAPEKIGLDENDPLEELSGTVAKSKDDIYMAESNFPTLCVRNCELREETSWYFEVHIEQAGLAQIGFIDGEATCDDPRGRGCGDDAHGWAYDGKRKVKWHVDSKEFGSNWTDGDVVGVAVRIKAENKCDIYFSLNGSFSPPMGRAFEDATFSNFLRPALTFNKTFAGRIQLRKWKYSPPDDSYRAIFDDERMEEADASSKNQEEEPKYVALTPDILAPEPGLDPEFFQTIFDMADELPPAAQVLRVLYELGLCPADTLVNRRLSNKLVWQLQDALAVCSGALPRWCFQAVHDFPFLFPLETRQVLFSSTALGVSRSLFRASTEYQQEGSMRGGSGRGSMSADALLGTSIQLKRQKVVLARKQVLEMGMRLLRTFAKNKCLLTVEFLDEIGHGLGPTLEFYAILCRELQRKDLGTWRYEGHSVTKASVAKVESLDNSEEAFTSYVSCPNGLFPAVLPENAPDQLRKRVLEIFRSIGRLIGRALLDERLLDLDFSELFLEKLLTGGSNIKQSVNGDQDIDLVNDNNEGFSQTDTDDLLAQLALIDPDLAKSLSKVYAMGVEYRDLSRFNEDPASQRRQAEIASEVDALQLEAVLPGAEDVRMPGLDGMAVTASNCCEYIRNVCVAICETGVDAQLAACHEGLAETLNPVDLRAFTITELRERLSGARDDEVWNESDIGDNIILRDYSRDSIQVMHLLEVLCELGKDDRRLFLRFLTGSPRLPIGGWAALRPKMSVVKKSSDSPDVLPSCSTCAVVLKLPQYASKEQLKEKLLFAIREGQNFFSMD